MNTSDIIRLSFVFCISFLFTINIQAQQVTGKIYGVITDEPGAFAPGATVTAKQISNTQNQVKIKTAVSNSEGEFSIDSLEPGTYNISVDYSFIGSYENENVTVVDNQATKLNIQLCVGGCESSSNSQKIELTDADKADIVNQILEDALVKKRIPDYGMLTEQKGEIILSSENIKTEWIKSLPNIKLKVMSEREIQNKADKSKDFLYLSFSNFRIAKKGIVVTMSNGWAVGKHSGMGYLSGGGSVYLYHKESGKWAGESLGGWIS